MQSICNPSFYSLLACSNHTPLCKLYAQGWKIGSALALNCFLYVTGSKMTKLSIWSLVNNQWPDLKEEKSGERRWWGMTKELLKVERNLFCVLISNPHFSFYLELSEAKSRGETWWKIGNQCGWSILLSLPFWGIFPVKIWFGDTIPWSHTVLLSYSSTYGMFFVPFITSFNCTIV